MDWLNVNILWFLVGARWGEYRAIVVEESVTITTINIRLI